MQRGVVGFSVTMHLSYRPDLCPPIPPPPGACTGIGGHVVCATTDRGPALGYRAYPTLPASRSMSGHTYWYS